MTTESAPQPQTTPEVGGMGHSVKRKEDPRFIRGARRVHRRRRPAGHALARHRPLAVRPRDDQGHRRVARRSRSRASSRSSPAPTSRRPASTGCRPSPATSRWCCRPTTVMYQAQEVAAVVATVRYAAADGVAAVDGRLRAAAGHRRPEQGARARRARPPARPRPGQADQPHLALGVRRPGGGRHGARRADVRGLRGHLHPAHPRRLDRDVRLHRRLGRRPRPADAPHDVARRRTRSGPSSPSSAGLPEQNIRVKTTTSAAASAARCRCIRATCSPSSRR